MQRKVDRKLPNPSGICYKLLHFFTKHLSFSISKTVILGSTKPEDYEIAIEHVQRVYEKAEDKQNIQEEIKMGRKKTETEVGEKVEDEKKVVLRKKPSMAKKEKVRFESNIDDRSGKFIKKGELFAA